MKIDPPQPFDEVGLATKMVALVKNISNIDGILAADDELHKRLLQSSADLLHSAGYDRNAYLQWVNDGEVTALPSGSKASELIVSILDKKAHLETNQRSGLFFISW